MNNVFYEVSFCNFCCRNYKHPGCPPEAVMAERIRETYGRECEHFILDRRTYENGWKPILEDVRERRGIDLPITVEKKSE